MRGGGGGELVFGSASPDFCLAGGGGRKKPPPAPPPQTHPQPPPPTHPTPPPTINYNISLGQGEMPMGWPFNSLWNKITQYYVEYKLLWSLALALAKST